MTIKHEEIDIYFHMKNHYRKLKAVKSTINSCGSKGHNNKRVSRPPSRTSYRSASEKAGDQDAKKNTTPDKKPYRVRRDSSPIFNPRLPNHSAVLIKHDCVHQSHTAQKSTHPTDKDVYSVRSAMDPHYPNHSASLMKHDCLHQSNIAQKPTHPTDKDVYPVRSAMDPHYPNHSASLMKHDCLDHHEKILTQTPKASTRPSTRRHPMDMPEPSKSPVRSKVPAPSRPSSLGPHVQRHAIPQPNAQEENKKKRRLKSRKRRSPSRGRKKRSKSNPRDAYHNKPKSPTDQNSSKQEEDIKAAESAESQVSDQGQVSEDSETSSSVKLSASANDYEYLQFLLRITEDIIRNDLYTNREMRTVCKSHFEANRGTLNDVKMRKQINILCNELGIAPDHTEESPPPSREVVKRRRQEIESTLVCCGQNISRPIPARDQDCECGAVHCLPFQCTPRPFHSEIELCGVEYPGISEFIPSCSKPEPLDSVSSYTYLAEEDTGNQASNLPSILSSVKCICENLGCLSEHTEPNDSDKDSREQRFRTVTIMSEDKGDENSKHSENSETINGEISQDRNEPVVEAKCDVIDNIIPEKSSGNDLVQPANVEPVEEKCSKAECNVMPCSCHEEVGQPEVDENETAQPEDSGSSKGKSTSLSPEFAEEQQTTLYHGKLLDSCNIAPDFCSHMSPKLLESCNILPDFCASLSDQSKPEAPVNKIDDVPQDLHTVSKIKEEDKEPNVDDGKKLITVDYDLTPEKDEIKLPLELVPTDITDCLPKLSDFKLQDLLLDDSYQVPERPGISNVYPTWFLKPVEVQTGPSLEDFSLRPVMPPPAKSSSVSKLNSTSSSASGPPQIKANVQTTSSSSTSGPYQYNVNEDVQTTSSSSTSGPYQYNAESSSLSHSSEPPQGNANSEIDNQLSSSGGSVPPPSKEDVESSSSHNESSESEPKENTTEEKSTSTEETEGEDQPVKGNDEGSESTDENSKEHSSADEKDNENNGTDEDSDEDANGVGEEEKSEDTAEETSSRDVQSVQAYTSADADAVSIDSDLDDSGTEDINEFMKELNKKPVLTVTRSIEDRIASVTDRLDKFRQVNEVRTVSASTTLEESIKKTMSQTEGITLSEEPKSFHEFHFIPPTIDHSETDTSCCPTLLKKRKPAKDKAISKTIITAEALSQKPQHVIVAQHPDNIAEAQPQTTRRSIRFSRTGI